MGVGKAQINGFYLNLKKPKGKERDKEDKAEHNCSDKTRFLTLQLHKYPQIDQI
jgi:hypothetical protein